MHLARYVRLVTRWWWLLLLGALIGGGSAYGSMVGARDSSDTTQQIGCSMYSYSSSSTAFAYCDAKDKDNKSLTCYSYNLSMREAVQAITDSSYIYFTADSSAVCTYLSVQNKSYYMTIG